MSPVKEPFFFSTDLKRPAKLFHSFKEYERLFAAATKDHIAVGEASTDYLYSETAVPNILEYADSPKFIVMIRNPIHMAHAVHWQMVLGGLEPITSFARAWEIQKERMKGKYIPRLGADPKLYLYGPRCKLGEQLERLFDQVPREQVLVLVLDDVKENPRGEYLKVLKFLGVPDDGREQFPVHNPAQVPRSILSQRGLHLVATVIRRAGFRRPLHISPRLKTWTRVVHPRPSLPLDYRYKLAEYFAEDIKKLEGLLKRDFSMWLEQTVERT